MLLPTNNVGQQAPTANHPTPTAAAPNTGRAGKRPTDAGSRNEQWTTHVRPADLPRRGRLRNSNQRLSQSSTNTICKPRRGVARHGCCQHPAAKFGQSHDAHREGRHDHGMCCQHTPQAVPESTNRATRTCMKHRSPWVQPTPSRQIRPEPQCPAGQVPKRTRERERENEKGLRGLCSPCVSPTHSRQIRPEPHSPRRR